MAGAISKAGLNSAGSAGAPAPPVPPMLRSRFFIRLVFALGTARGGAFLAISSGCFSFPFDCCWLLCRSASRAAQAAVSPSSGDAPTAEGDGDAAAAPCAPSPPFSRAASTVSLSWRTSGVGSSTDEATAAAPSSSELSSPESTEPALLESSLVPPSLASPASSCESSSGSSDAGIISWSAGEPVARPSTYSLSSHSVAGLRSLRSSSNSACVSLSSLPSKSPFSRCTISATCSACSSFSSPICSVRASIKSSPKGSVPAAPSAPAAKSFPLAAA
mmetsp:Transcript_2594/g.7706  ORF Transcript_2594/g.7706 Transcript_2594/m.7706 type:complete len:275 (-) Transcript_2594:122-946(-)